MCRDVQVRCACSWGRGRGGKKGSEKESLPSLPLVRLVLPPTTVAAARMDVAVGGTVVMHVG